MIEFMEIVKKGDSGKNIEETQNLLWDYLNVNPVLLEKLQAEHPNNRFLQNRDNFVDGNFGNTSILVAQAIKTELGLDSFPFVTPKDNQLIEQQVLELATDKLLEEEREQASSKEITTDQKVLPSQAQAFDAMVIQESGNRHRDNDGNLITSSAGAKGVSQLMPTTMTDPGYGVRPLQNESREEYYRVGKDYYDTMCEHYAVNGEPNMELGMMAYNAGPGNLNKHIKRHGIPQTKEEMEAFVAAFPYRETRDYVKKNMERLDLEVGDSLPQGEHSVIAHLSPAVQAKVETLAETAKIQEIALASVKEISPMQAPSLLTPMENTPAPQVPSGRTM